MSVDKNLFLRDFAIAAIMKDEGIFACGIFKKIFAGIIAGLAEFFRANFLRKVFCTSVRYKEGVFLL